MIKNSKLDVNFMFQKRYQIYNHIHVDSLTQYVSHVTCIVYGLTSFKNQMVS